MALSLSGCGARLVRRSPGTGDLCVVAVHRLRDVEVELLAGRHADVTAVAVDARENLLRVSVHHALCAFERSIRESRGGEGSERRSTPFGENIRRPAEQRSRVELQLGEIVALDEPSAEPGAAIGNRLGVGGFVALMIQCDAGHAEFFPGLPNKRPSAITGDPLANPVHLRASVDFRPCGNHEHSVMKNVFGDECSGNAPSGACERSQRL